MENQTREKKPYAPPTVTEHGNAVKKTLGLGGKYWEPVMNQYRPVIGNDEEEVD